MSKPINSNTCPRPTTQEAQDLLHQGRAVVLKLMAHRQQLEAEVAAGERVIAWHTVRRPAPPGGRRGIAHFDRRAPSSHAACMASCLALIRARRRSWSAGTCHNRDGFRHRRRFEPFGVTGHPLTCAALRSPRARRSWLARGRCAEKILVDAL